MPFFFTAKTIYCSYVSCCGVIFGARRLGCFATEDIYGRETSNKSQVGRKQNISRYGGGGRNYTAECGPSVCLYRLQIYTEVKMNKV